MRKFVYVKFILYSLVRERKKTQPFASNSHKNHVRIIIFILYLKNRGLSNKKDPKFMLFIISKADPKIYFQLLNYFCWNVLYR